MDNQTRDREVRRESIGQEKAMSWYGFGSPVGLGILLLCAGITAVLLRVALLGF